MFLMEAHLLVYLRRGNQQHKIGIFWKERTDHHLPEWKRDWYLICDRGGFILEHRSYINGLLAAVRKRKEQIHARGKVYYITFEDIDGQKTHIEIFL